uniref:Uncharacterized protein n=1 Tax=Octopus bimaculoides TaxID=37653 RepID=A0A0L8H2X6_OCTBM
MALVSVAKTPRNKHNATYINGSLIFLIVKPINSELLNYFHLFYYYYYYYYYYYDYYHYYYFP